MNLSEVENETILYACNDWGLGHVARSISIIQQLIRQKNKVFFAGNAQQRKIILTYCSEIHDLPVDGYNFKFTGNGNWSLEMLSNAFNFRKGMNTEFKQVEQWCTDYPITLVLSDHRYGFRSRNVPSVFITHQVTLPLKGIQKIVNLWHTKQLRKFSSIWVLDDEAHTFAGKLSMPTSNLPIHYIGIQSRFLEGNYPQEDFVLAVVSGPEPYAEQFFKEIIQCAKSSKQVIKCICPSNYSNTNVPSNLEVIHGLSWKEMDELFYRCSSIISRSGYTTIMDVARLHKKAIYIPTPGQLEQEYLFDLHSN